MEQSDQAKLDEIRATAKREAAQNAQREQALLGRSESDKKGPQIGFGFVALFIAVLFGLIWVFSKDDSSGQAAEDRYASSADAIRVAEEGVKFATLKYLEALGYDRSLATNFDIDSFPERETYILTFDYSGKKTGLVADFKCQASLLDVDRRSGIECYTWTDLNEVQRAN